MSELQKKPESMEYSMRRVGLGATVSIVADNVTIATAWFPPIEDDSVFPVSIMKTVGWVLEAANACRGMADPAAEIARLRMLEATAKAAGWISTEPGIDAGGLPQAAGRALIQKMSDISEETWCAGWLNTVDFDLYRLCLAGGGEYGMGTVSKEDAANLLSLAELAGGWGVWVDGKPEPEIVPMDQWKAMYAQREAARKARKGSK